MRAMLAQQTDPSPRISKSDQIFAQEVDPNRRAVRRRDFFREQRWNPVTPDEFTHRRARPDAGQEFILLPRKHLSHPFVVSQCLIFQFVQSYGLSIPLVSPGTTLSKWQICHSTITMALEIEAP